MRIGDMLVSAGLINEQQLKEILVKQKEEGIPRNPETSDENDYYLRDLTIDSTSGTSNLGATDLRVSALNITLDSPLRANNIVFDVWNPAQPAQDIVQTVVVEA